MTRTCLGLALAWLALDAGASQAQFGYRNGIGFSVGGKHGHVAGFVGSWSGMATPYWPTPYCVGGWWHAPLVIVQQPVVVVQRPVVLQVVVPPRAEEPREDPLAAARVEARVQRGELVAIRPQANALRPAAAVEPVPERVREPEPVVPNEPKARAVFEVARAREAFAAGQYGRAAERLAEALAGDRAGARPYFLLAQARMARGEYAEAVAAIREGLRLDPDWPAARFSLKDVYGPTAEKFDVHLADLKDAVAAEPDNPTLGFLLGYHLWFLGERAEAVKRFRQATTRVRDNGVIERFLLEAVK